MTLPLWMNYQDADASEELEKAVGKNFSLSGDADRHGHGDRDEDEGGGDHSVIEHVQVDWQVHPTDYKTIKKLKLSWKICWK